MKVADQQVIQELRLMLGRRVKFNEWDSVLSWMRNDTVAMLSIETFEVKVLVREDRYEKRGTRTLILSKNSNGLWKIDVDSTLWDDSFVPYVYEKIGRRQTVEEFTQQREWEKLCHRPGNGRFPLDSYDRVLDPYFKSTDKMERHF